MHQIRFPLDSAPDPIGGAYSAPPKPPSCILILRGLLLMGGERKGKGREGKGRKGRKRKGEREGMEQKGEEGLAYSRHLGPCKI